MSIGTLNGSYNMMAMMALITMQAICNESNAFQNAKVIICGKKMFPPLKEVDFMVSSTDNCYQH